MGSFNLILEFFEPAVSRHGAGLAVREQREKKLEATSTP